MPRFGHLSEEETYLVVANTVDSLNVLQMMRGLSVAADAIYKSKGPSKGWSYHLIILNSLKRTVQIKPYDRDSFGQAIIDYSRVEAEAAKGKKIEPVLVSAGPLGKLRRAYPNFFLDIDEFASLVSEIVSASGIKK